jgi:hypothetical protein
MFPGRNLNCPREQLKPFFSKEQSCTQGEGVEVALKINLNLFVMKTFMSLRKKNSFSPKNMVVP